MANKQLTARVKLNTTDAENKLKRLSNLFRNLDRTTGTVGKNKSIEQNLTRNQQKIQDINAKVRQWASNQHQVTSAAKSTEGTLGTISRKLKSIASTYLGIMGTKAVLNTSDTITSAQNRLNNINDYDTALTQQQMDKMYTSANKVRMSYTDMISNVSKSMTLAGGAFKGNVDNAIRFQEIMAEAYALGGASAEEMRTSMYQMIQALGGNLLAGDELRSVREGAPLAYQEIEKFAQEVYNSTASLKDMASEGKITSDIVVAAVMQAGEGVDGLDAKFQKTKATFGQTWSVIKNQVVKVFEPISDELNAALQRAIKSGAFEKLGKAFIAVGKAVFIAFEIIGRAIQWVGDNWSWLKYILIAGLIIYASYLIITTKIALEQAKLRIKAWIAEHGAMLKTTSAILIGIYALIQIFQAWKEGAINTCDAVVAALLVVAVVCFFIYGWFAALIIACIALVIWLFEYICALVTALAAIIINILSFIWNVIIFVVQCIATAVAWLVGLIVNLIMIVWTVIVSIIAFIVNLVMAVGHTIAAVAYNAVAGIVNVAMGLFNVIVAVCQNIGIAFENCWIFAQNTFWSFVESVLTGLQALIQPISSLASLIGLDFSLDSTIKYVAAKQQDYKDFVSVSGAWSKGMNTMEYKDVGDSWSSGWNTMEFPSEIDLVNPNDWAANTWDTIGNAHTGYADVMEWGEAGLDWGSGVKGAINDWGSQFQNGGSSKESDATSLLDDMGNSLGLDFSDYGLPTDANLNYDPYDVLGKDVGDIADNTGSMADSMELSQEDLEYLRKIAAMEWKKEYTTASITVDMSNYNTINGDGDLDGIVTKLSDKLKEELSVVANGVYV